MRWAVRLATIDMPPHYIVTKSTGAIDLARELTIEDALEYEPNWILFLDSDVIPPIDVFHRLRRHREPVVSGLYYMDAEPVHPAAWRLDENGTPTSFEIQRQGLLEVDATGLGCMLVSREVFEAIDRPWFRWTRGYEDHPWDLRHRGERPGISEDFHFCYELAQAGYQLYLDTSVQCLHEKTVLLSDVGGTLESQADPTA